MKTTYHQSILIVEPNAQFREELCNFLLSAGYENVEGTDANLTFRPRGEMGMTIRMRIGV